MRKKKVKMTDLIDTAVPEFSKRKMEVYNFGYLELDLVALDKSWEKVC